MQLVALHRLFGYSQISTDQSGTAYIGNIEYNTLNGNTALTTLSRIYNDEGYVENPANPQYYYFRQDHLGDNREYGVPIPIQWLNALSIIPAAFRGHTTVLLTTRTYNTGSTTARSLWRCMGMIRTILFGGSIIRQ